MFRLLSYLCRMGKEMFELLEGRQKETRRNVEEEFNKHNQTNR